MKIASEPAVGAFDLNPSILKLPLYISKICCEPSFAPRPKMSMNSTSTAMLRGVLRGTRGTRFSPSVFEHCSRTIRPTVLNVQRNVSSAVRLPILTASETRRRPTLRPYQQPVAQTSVNVLSPTSKRTIFIQTENTPNPDVRAPSIRP